jgi:FAD/FMN-containing dehydrogenase
MTNRPESPPPDWSLLVSRIHGLLVRPEDPHFELARRVWNAAIDRTPAGIVVCARDSDASEAVRFASNAGLKVTVRGGGHNVAGRAVQDGALMVDLSALRAVRVDVRQQQIDAGGGATWRDLDAVAGAFGLAVPGGLVSSTGIGGLTLGGGIGWLTRHYGLSTDNLLTAEVVLADGRLVRASAVENPRLFWALRGGGGNVGVVTRFIFRAHPVGQVLAGGLWCDARRAREVLQRYRDFIAGAADELTTIATATIAPPAPFLPAALHMKPAIVIGMCWSGALASGATALAALRAAVAPEADLIIPQTYAALQQHLDPTAPYGLRNYWQSRFVDQLSDGALDWFAEQALQLPSHLSMIHCHQLGGAVARGSTDEPCAPLRQHGFVLNAVATWPSIDQDTAHRDWARRCANGFTSAAKGRTYVNFSTDLTPFTDDAFSAAMRRRLEDVKRDLDPSDLFC